MRWITRSLAVVSVAALVAGALAACDDDGDDGDAADDTETIEVSAEFCDARLEIEQALTDEDLEAAQAAIADLESSAPESVSADVATVADAIAEDPELLFEDDDAIAARVAIDDVVIEGCGFEVVDVTATEYEFEGVPDTLEADLTAFRLTNEGEELHEILIIAIPDDLDETVTEFFDRVDALFEAGDEAAAMELITFTAGAVAPPGGTDVGITELEPGRYVAICFIPVGSTSDEEEGDGPPHYHEGMLSEFTVT